MPFIPLCGSLASSAGLVVPLHSHTTSSTLSQEEGTDHYLLHWVNHWKPFYDAYYGPLKNKHQYWIGGTLLVRVVLAVISVVIQAIAPNINVLLVGIVSALLSILVTHVYSNQLKALLEASFLVNTLGVHISLYIIIIQY